MCPKSSDPLMNALNNREIVLIVTSSSKKQLLGLLGIKLYGATSYFILSNLTNSMCQQALESSNQIGSVVCQVNIVSIYEIHLNITFLTWPSMNIPDNNVFTNNGNPWITDFACDISQVILPSYVPHNNTITCHFYDIVSDNINGNDCILLS